MENQRWFSLMVFSLLCKNWCWISFLWWSPETGTTLSIWEKSDQKKSENLKYCFYVTYLCITFIISAFQNLIFSPLFSLIQVDTYFCKLGWKLFFVINVPYLIVILFLSHPLIADEFKDLIGLDIPHHKGAQEPWGVWSASRVIMPNSQVVHVTKRPESIHKKAKIKAKVPPLTSFGSWLTLESSLRSYPPSLAEGCLSTQGQGFWLRLSLPRLQAWNRQLSHNLTPSIVLWMSGSHKGTHPLVCCLPKVLRPGPWSPWGQCI